MDYRFTLNLPYTNFSMKANLAVNELDILRFWSDLNLYRIQKNRRKIFVLNDGPPYANGNIHIGHAFNKILKDFICKFKMLDGFFISFVPGWDCHGLPIELNVEKFIKKSSDLISDSDFRFLCRKYADDQLNLQKKSFMRLGVNALWHNFYKTMDFEFEASIVKTFKFFVEHNYIYNSVRPVYWCFDCCSALADAELEYLDKQSDSLYIFFEIFDFSSFFDKFYFSKVGFIVWTTTPWTLPFNEAVALNPNSEYVLVAFKDVGYIFDKKLLEFVVKKLNFTRFHVLFTFNSNFFLNMRIIHPFYNKFVKVVLSEHVTSESGTGCVHIAPAYGYDDYKVALKFKLPVKNSVDIHGYFYGEFDDLSNFNVKNVNPFLIDRLKNNNGFLFHEFIVHRYPHCWRHKSPLIFRTTSQWFLNIDSNFLRDKLLDFSINYVNWIPESGKKKIYSMITDRPDWCLSRQRLWGVPIFFFVNKIDGSLHPNTVKILNSIIPLVCKNGTNFWYNSDIFNMFDIDSNIYSRVSDVLDVWYDSGSVYKFILDRFSFLNLPFDLYLEGSDQYRGWFQSSLINSVANYNLPCFKTVLAHGFVLDGFGRKMSKSLNNVISPDDVIASYGADILRLWASSVNYCFDVNISDEILTRVCESYRKIRNTFRFLLANTYDLNKEDFLLNFNKIIYFDKWILMKFLCLRNDILNEFNNYKFYSIYKRIYNFCIDDLGSKYFEVIKDRLYLSKNKSVFRISAQLVLYYILYNLTKLVAPIISFTSEEIWVNMNLTDSKSVYMSDFDIDVNLVFNFNSFNIKDLILFDKLFYLKNSLNKIIEENRINKICGTSLELVLNFYCNVYWFNLLFSLKNDIYLFFLISQFNMFLSNNIISGGFIFILNKSSLIKCDRCWHRNVLFGKLRICFRCICNIYYNGEFRSFF